MPVAIITATKNSGPLIGRHYRQLVACFEGRSEPFEIMYVDDGSRDHSTDIIAALARRDRRVRGIFLDQSCGQQAALTVGLAATTGDPFLTLDVDLEVPADASGPLVDAIRSGADYAVGRRIQRARRHMSRSVGSIVFNISMRLMTGLPISDFGCGASAGTRTLANKAFQSVIPFRGVKHLFGQLADSLVEIPVREVALPGHRSAYGRGELLRALAFEHRKQRRLALPEHVAMSGTPGPDTGGAGTKPVPSSYPFNAAS